MTALLLFWFGGLLLGFWALFSLLTLLFLLIYSRLSIGALFASLLFLLFSIPLATIAIQNLLTLSPFPLV